MSDASMVRARSGDSLGGASPRESMVRASSATVASGASRIPFRRASRFRRLAWRCRSSTMLEQVLAMAMRKREDEAFPNGGGGCWCVESWVAVPAGSTDDAVRECGVMTDDPGANDLLRSSSAEPSRSASGSSQPRRRTALHQLGVFLRRRHCGTAHTCSRLLALPKCSGGSCAVRVGPLA